MPGMPATTVNGSWPQKGSSLRSMGDSSPTLMNLVNAAEVENAKTMNNMARAMVEDSEAGCGTAAASLDFLPGTAASAIFT